MLLAKCFPTSSRTADFSCPCVVPKTTILGDRRIVWNKQIILQNSMHTSFGWPFKLPKQMRWFYHHGIIWNLSPEQKDPHAAPRAKPPPGRIAGVKSRPEIVVVNDVSIFSPTSRSSSFGGCFLHSTPNLHMMWSQVVIRVKS